MFRLKNFGLILLIIIPLLILVIARSTGHNHFRNDSKKWASASFEKKNTVNLEKLSKLDINSLLVCLNTASLPQELPVRKQSIPADSVISKKYLKKIMSNNGPVILYSTDPGLSARLWMILSQLGRRDLYILAKDSDEEVMKYKFRPDSTSN